jgi:hypothetical protein
MLERFIQSLSCSDVGAEDPSVTRDRLKDRFPRGATRRMTQLGLLVGTALDELRPGPDDAIVYASAFAETRALEAYLDSFPTPSPTLFQTSIHPSAVQQVMIGRQQPVREFFPITGRAHLVAQALQTAALCSAPRVIVCGGEERGTWLLEHGVASDRSFAFACALSAEPTGALARITLSPTPEAAVNFSLPEFHQTLTSRSPLSTVAAPGLQLTLTWL